MPCGVFAPGPPWVQVILALPASAALKSSQGARVIAVRRPRGRAAEEPSPVGQRQTAVPLAACLTQVVNAGRPADRRHKRAGMALGIALAVLAFTGCAQPESQLATADEPTVRPNELAVAGDRPCPRELPVGDDPSGHGFGNAEPAHLLPGPTEAARSVGLQVQHLRPRRDRQRWRGLRMATQRTARIRERRRPSYPPGCSR